VIKTKFLFFILINYLFFNFSIAENIVYADLDSIIKNSDVGKKIIFHFSKKNENLIEEIKNEEIKIKNKEKSLITQKNILDTEEYSKKVNILKEEIDQFNNNNSNKLKQLNKEKDEISKKFMVEVNRIIKEFAEKNNIEMILSSNHILIGKSNLDVTNEILKLVNDKIKKFEIKNNG
tara:strand:+ start:9190 stop:9720 length:531 start_codon:yes stop_codon:yes gene_type:complete